MSISFLVAPLPQTYCRYTAHPTTLKGEGTRSLKERGEEVFVDTHDPCGQWGTSSPVVLHWEREEAFSFSDQMSTAQSKENYLVLKISEK